jgi:hypothetical protein
VVGQRGVVRARVATEHDLRHALAVLAQASVPARDVTLDGSGAALVIPTQLTPDWPKVELEIAGGVSQAPTWERGLGAASLVAEGSGAEAATGPSLYPDAAATLAAAGVRPIGVSAAGARLSFLVLEGGLDEAVRALHRRFVA